MITINPTVRSQAKSAIKFAACATLTAIAVSLHGTQATASAPHATGLGNVLTSKDGGEIFGFGIDQTGDSGVIATSQDTDSGYRVSVETFDQNTGKIIKSFAKDDGPRNSYSVDGVFEGDVGLITHYIVPQGQIYPRRRYEVMNPIAANAFTARWTPPPKDIDVRMASTDQSTATSVLFAIELKKQDQPVLLVSDIAANTFSNVIPLDPNLFGGANGPQLAQFTSANKAVIALSPDGGTRHGQPPINALIDLSSGKIVQFDGYNNGYYHAGGVNGLAVDPDTGVAATDTELNAQVEFYDLKKKQGITFQQLPCTTDTDQLSSGSGISVDPVNKLFLVTERLYCDGSQGSAIVVYDEQGNEVETITGFHFFIGETAPVLNPSKRMAWAFGGPQGWSQLQQFFY